MDDVTTFREHLEMSGNLTAVREKSWGSCPLHNSSLELCQCLVGLFWLHIAILEGVFVCLVILDILQ